MLGGWGGAGTAASRRSSSQGGPGVPLGFGTKMGTWGNIKGRGGTTDLQLPPRRRDEGVPRSIPTPAGTQAPPQAWSRCFPGESPGELGRPRAGAAHPVPVNAGTAPACGRPGRGGGSPFPAAPLWEASVVGSWRHRVCPLQAPAPDRGRRGGHGGQRQSFPPPKAAPPNTRLSLGGSVWGSGGGNAQPGHPEWLLLGPGGFFG